MAAWFVARQWEALFAAGALAVVPSWAWLAAGAVACPAWLHPGRTIPARIARAIGALFVAALALLALAGSFAAWRVGDATLAAQLRAHAALPFLTALAGVAACGLGASLVAAWRARRAVTSSRDA